MIKNFPVKVDVSVTKDLPKISKEVERIERALKSKPKDKDLLAELKEQQKEFDKIEATLAANLAKLVVLHKELVDAITPLNKRPNLPDSLKGDIGKLFNICTNSRAKEMKDLENAQKKKELHTNPAKIDRVCGDLNGDATEFNKLEGALDKEIDAEYATEWKKVESAVAKLCSDAKPPVNPAAINANSVLKSKFEALKKTRWKDYDAKVKAFLADIGKDVARASRRVEIIGFRTEFANLKVKTREKIIEDAIAKDLGVAATKTLLEDAMAAQLKPSKSQWTQHLGMTGYSIAGISDKYTNLAIHVTFDKNSWSPETDGKICVKANNADAIMEKLFGTVNWTYQLHATLEIKNGADKRPHVYWGGAANHWDTTAAFHGKNAAWIDGGKKKLTSVLATVKAGIRTKVQKAIDAHGAI